MASAFISFTEYHINLAQGTEKAKREKRVFLQRSHLSCEVTSFCLEGTKSRTFSTKFNFLGTKYLKKGQCEMKTKIFLKVEQKNVQKTWPPNGEAVSWIQF